MTQAKKKKSTTKTSTSHQTKKGKQIQYGLSVHTDTRAGGAWIIPR